MSGSGIAREWKARKDQSGAVLADEESEALYQYSFVGPLSMSKGCDLTHQPQRDSVFQSPQSYDRKRSNLPDFIYRGIVAMLFSETSPLGFLSLLAMS